MRGLACHHTLTCKKEIRRLAVSRFNFLHFFSSGTSLVSPIHFPPPSCAFYFIHSTNFFQSYFIFLSIFLFLLFAYLFFQFLSRCFLFFINRLILLYFLYLHKFIIDFFKKEHISHVCYFPLSFLFSFSFFSPSTFFFHIFFFYQATCAIMDQPKTCPKATVTGVCFR